MGHCKFIINTVKLGIITDLELSKQLNLEQYIGAHKCEVCIQANHYKHAYNNITTPRNKYVPDLVHTDVCGAITSEAYSSDLYSVTFIDDYTAFQAVYPIKEKLEVFKKFSTFWELGCLRKENTKNLQWLRGRI